MRRICTVYEQEKQIERSEDQGENSNEMERGYYLFTQGE